MKSAYLFFAMAISLWGGGAKAFLHQKPAPKLALQVVNACPDAQFDPDGKRVSAYLSALCKALEGHLEEPDAPKDTARLIVAITSRTFPPPPTPGLSIIGMFSRDPRMGAYTALGIARAHIKRLPQLGYDPAVITATIALVKGNPDGFSISTPLDPGEIIANMERLPTGVESSDALVDEEARSLAKAVATFLKTQFQWPTNPVRP